MSRVVLIAQQVVAVAVAALLLQYDSVSISGLALALVALAYGALVLLLHARSGASAGAPAEPGVGADEDRLTGLLTRRAFTRTLRTLAELAKRSKMPLVLVCARIDGLARVDSAQGPARGDHVLHAMSEITRQHLRATDVAARFGGDEVVLLLTDATPVGAEIVTERLRERFAEVVREQALELELVLEVAAVVPEADLDEQLHALLRRA